MKLDRDMFPFTFSTRYLPISVVTKTELQHKNEGKRLCDSESIKWAVIEK